MDIQLYYVCDVLSGVTIFLMVIFSPWAFGTTQPWSIWTMNIAGFSLGVLLLVKWFIREIKGYPAPRWGNFSAGSGISLRRHHPLARLLTRVLAVLTLVFLVYCLISALNAAAVCNPDSRLFVYRHHIDWLPHSFDGRRSWFYFWMYLGLACSFWAIWDWLLGMTAGEGCAAHLGTENVPRKSSLFLPARLRWLLCVICINGAMVGVEATVQRVSGSTKLLFLVQPLVNPKGEAQFGPYAYRANAAQYFNMIWPLCLGFWWTLHRASGFRAGHHHMFLAGAAVMAACPIISTSRGGAMVTAGILVLVMFYLARLNFSAPQSRRGTVIALIVFFVAAIGLGWMFGWNLLEPRMEQISEGFQSREEMYKAAHPMAEDYPLFGTGPGTFATAFQLYRVSNSTYWPEQLHNDWLETRITFGWIGTTLLLASLVCVFLRQFVRGEIRSSRTFVTLAWLALAGCLVHAWFDFPFQIHSVLFSFLLICAVLFSLSGSHAVGTQQKRK